MTEKNTESPKLHNVRVSDAAYKKLRAVIDAKPIFKSRGMVGAIDFFVLKRFTTLGTGRKSVRGIARKKKH